MMMMMPKSRLSQTAWELLEKMIEKNQSSANQESRHHCQPMELWKHNGTYFIEIPGEFYEHSTSLHDLIHRAAEKFL